MATEKRLIDANALEAQFHNTKLIEIFPYWRDLPFSTQIEVIRFAEAFKQMMQNAPSVDAVEVVHGRWEDVFKGNCAWERYKCSVCGGYALYRHEQVFDEWKTVQVLANYCPYCGAYMENGEENGEM